MGWNRQSRAEALSFTLAAHLLQSFGSFFIAITLLCLSSANSHAGSSRTQRYLQTTTAFECKHRLLEQVGVAGGGLYFWHSLFIACLSNRGDVASLLLFSMQECTSDTGKCNSELPQNAPPRFVSQDYGKNSLVEFHLVRYVIGTDCRLQTQKIIGARDLGNYDIKSWYCRTFEVHDGAKTDKNDLSVRNWKTTTVTDKGSSAPHPVDANEFYGLSIPQDLFSLNWLTEVFGE